MTVGYLLLIIFTIVVLSIAMFLILFGRKYNDFADIWGAFFIVILCFVWLQTPIGEELMSNFNQLLETKLW